MLIYNLLARVFRRKDAMPNAVEKAGEDSQSQIRRIEIDPLDKHFDWDETDQKPVAKFLSVEDFPFEETSNGSTELVTANGKTLATDSALKVRKVALDDGTGSPGDIKLSQSFAIPQNLISWYMTQGFIGYQACATIAQHWLVNKAISMPGEDAIRNGWQLRIRGTKGSLDEEEMMRVQDADNEIGIKKHLIELNRFKNMFGIRIAIFNVESSDRKYYEKPFNIDGVTEGSYKGISQVDPYWMTPLMTAASTSDPSAPGFYEPEFWIINNKKYHRSHLVIVRGPEPADILKPSYLFGGIPMTQMIYERVYAAERTANESPLLALSKRTNAIHVDLEKASLNEEKFTARLMRWIRFRDNHAVKVLGKDEKMEQFDISMGDFDSVIMNQYQIASAICKVPATKLLGTSPKGFNATGEFEMLSYHEELESINEHVMWPMLCRHYLLLSRSLGFGKQIEAIMNPVDSLTATMLAELNLKKAQTDQINADLGAVSPDEVRTRLRDDRRSGYVRLDDVDANEKPGLTPMNIAELQKAGAEVKQAEAREMSAEAQVEKVAKMPDGGAAGQPGNPARNGGTVPGAAAEGEEDSSVAPAPATTQTKIAPPSNNDVAFAKLLGTLVDRLEALHDVVMPDGGDVSIDRHARTTKPSNGGSVAPSVAGINSVVPEMPAHMLPKMKMGGMALSIENPRGSLRKGIGTDGQPWVAKMAHHYGFIRGTVGADGDEMDCFVGPNPQSQKVFVINQNDPTTDQFDEHKCMLGFDDAESAKKGYDDSFNPVWGGFRSIHEVSLDEFKSWLKSGQCARQFGS